MGDVCDDDTDNDRVSDEEVRNCCNLIMLNIHLLPSLFEYRITASIYLIQTKRTVILTVMAMPVTIAI